MGIQRPTLQARAGFDPTGFGPGIQAPYGYSTAYRGHHNGEDWFWLLKDSAAQLGISTEQSKRVYPVVNGFVGHTQDDQLGLGTWQQIADGLRFYSWHLRDREPEGYFRTDETSGRMGRTGSLAGEDEHLHTEVRRAPYRKEDRINPAPFFTEAFQPAGDDGTPIPQERNPMYTLQTLSPGPGIDLLGLVGGRRMRIANTYHLSLLRRARLDDPGILQGELDIVQGYITAVNAPVTASNAEALQKLNQILAEIQQLDSEDDTPTTVDTGPLLDAIAALSPLIEAVPAAVVDELKTRL